MRENPRIVRSATELRLEIRDYADRFSHVVQTSADQIRESTDDRAIRRAALEWKAEAIPMAQTACYHSDPLAALFDTWAFAVQQRMYFEGEGAERVYGEQLPIALAGAVVVEEELEQMARDLVEDDDISDGEALVAAWAEANPIGGEWLGRRSILPSLGSVIAAENLGGLAAVGRLTEDMSDITMRVSLYNEFIPRQVRWQTELLLDDLRADELVDTTLEVTPELVAIALRAVTVMEEMPEFVGSERDSVLEFAEESRDIAIETVARERELVLDAVGLQLIDTLEHMDALWPTVREDLPEVVESSMDRSAVALEAVVDHAVWRVAQLGGVGLLALFAIGIVLIRVARRR